MKILVFDTCLDKMYVTLSEDDKILSSEVVTNKDNKYHSAFLISTIKDVLKKNNLSPKDIDAIGTNIGPGSFTGIRACTTVARMIAYLYCDEEVKGAIQLDEIKKQLEKADYYLITDDKMQKELGGTSYQQAEYPLGDILAKLAYEKLKSSSAKWQELKPLYIQPPPMG